MIEYVLNETIKKEVDWAGLEYPSSAPIMPIYANISQEAPFILYSWSDTTVSDEKFYQQVGYIRYFIYETNIDKLNLLRGEVKRVLNVGDHVSTIKSHGHVSPNRRVLFCGTNFGIAGPPLERDGTAFTYLEFKVLYL